MRTLLVILALLSACQTTPVVPPTPPVVATTIPHTHGWILTGGGRDRDERGLSIEILIFTCSCHESLIVPHKDLNPRKRGARHAR